MTVRQASGRNFDGMFVVAKFFLSRSPEGEMGFITRTLGKLGLLDNQFKGTIQDQEFWLCEIKKEIMPRTSKGAFILTPTKRIDAQKIKKIIPGFYDYEKVDGVALVKPNLEPEEYWILSKITRQLFEKKHRAIIVPIQYDRAQNASLEN
jgi:hypothetical protein